MKIRCSSLGRLMGGFERPKAPLTEDAKTLIREMFIADTYGRQQIIGSKEMLKGTRVEEDSIALLSEARNKLYVKSRKEYENDLLTGHIDLMDEDVVIDIKSPFNIWTFMSADLCSAYAWQLTGYMWLTGKKKAELIYVLIDTPEDMIFDEVRRATYTTGVHDNSEDCTKLEQEIRKNFTYQDIPAGKRIKTFDLEFDEAKIELIKEKYKLALEYYQFLKTL